MTELPFDVTVETDWPYLIVIGIREGMLVPMHYKLDRASATFLANSILTAVERSEGLELKFEAS